jgi:hypothetical protein
MGTYSRVGGGTEHDGTKDLMAGCEDKAGEAELPLWQCSLHLDSQLVLAPDHCLC